MLFFLTMCLLQHFRISQISVHCALVFRSDLCLPLQLRVCLGPFLLAISGKAMFMYSVEMTGSC